MAGRILVPYEEKRKLILACDASPFGVGAVVSLVMDDGEEHPIAFASRTLPKTERKYLQIERGDSSYYVRRAKIPQVPVWTSVSSVYRPQALSEYSEPKNSSTNSHSSHNQPLGSNFTGLQLRSGISTIKSPWQC